MESYDRDPMEMKKPFIVEYEEERDGGVANKPDRSESFVLRILVRYIVKFVYFYQDLSVVGGNCIRKENLRTNLFWDWFSRELCETSCAWT